ncbi:MAG TPA: hypothetical protein VHA76_02625 [Solirubrobacterales bacterium]|nr:hypothetical protein [Solirubrobacterales bacterium]
MARRIVSVALIAGAGALVCAAAALAITTQIGPLKVSATGEFEPHGFPPHGTLPTTFTSTVHIRSLNGKAPPALKSLTFEFDKHGRLNFKGVPTCTAAKLEGATPSQARSRCAGALVGTGIGKARVQLPGGQPFTMTSPISIFNAPPRDGKPTMIAHAWETVPSPQALLTEFTISRISHGRYGYRTEIELPPIAGGDGVAILAEASFGRTFRRGGREVGYVEAECSGGRLQAYGRISFLDGSHLQSLLSSPCHTEG